VFYIDKKLKYEGCFKNGNRHGLGTQWTWVPTLNDFRKVYEGFWKDNYPWKGKKFFTNGSIIEVENGREKEDS